MNAPVGGGRAAHLQPIAALTEYEVELGVIAADAVELTEELGRLRSHASDLGRAVSKRDESIAEQQRTIAQLEVELARLRECVGEASEALRVARARIVELDRQADALSLESDGLRADLAEREALLGQVREAWGTARDLLVEQGRRLARESTARHHAVHEAKRLQSRVEALERQLGAKPGADRSAAGAETVAETVGGHVRLVALPNGYRIVVSSDGCPTVGDSVDIDGVSLVVVRTGRSPLPGDRRPCAFLSTG
jgi:chromosome segregation ATPase